MKYTLSLTAEQINVVFAALGKLPFETVFGVINEINAQLGTQAQLSAPPSEVAESDSE